MAPTLINVNERSGILPDYLYLRCEGMENRVFVVERSKLYKHSSSIQSVFQSLGPRAPLVIMFHDLSMEQLLFLYDTVTNGVATVLHHERLAYDRLARALKLVGDVNPLPWSRIEDPIVKKDRVYGEFDLTKQFQQVAIRTSGTTLYYEVVSNIQKGIKRKRMSFRMPKRIL